MYYHSPPERRSETSRNDRGIVVAVVQRTISESWLPSVPDKPERELLMNRVARSIVFVSYHDRPIKFRWRMACTLEVSTHWDPRPRDASLLSWDESVAESHVVRA